MHVATKTRNSMDGSESKKNVLLAFDAACLAKCIAALPGGAFIVCIVLSVLFDFDQSTATHCKNTLNYLPSISAAVGGFSPQRYIWRMCIALHCAPRFILAICYRNLYMTFCHGIARYRYRLYVAVVHVVTTVYVLENICLLVLSFVSSTENYGIHEKGFIGFAIFSEIYMVLTVVLLQWKRRSGSSFTATDGKSLSIKSYLLLLNFTSCCAAGYFFVRHNSYCESGVYTLFAVCEYLIVVTNIGFHDIHFYVNFYVNKFPAGNLEVKPVKDLLTVS